MMDWRGNLRCECSTVIWTECCQHLATEVILYWIRFIHVVNAQIGANLTRTSLFLHKQWCGGISPKDFYRNHYHHLLQTVWQLFAQLRINKNEKINLNWKCSGEFRLPSSPNITAGFLFRTLEIFWRCEENEVWYEVDDRFFAAEDWERSLAPSQSLYRIPANL